MYTLIRALYPSLNRRTRYVDIEHPRTVLGNSRLTVLDLQFVLSTDLGMSLNDEIIWRVGYGGRARTKGRDTGKLTDELTREVI